MDQELMATVNAPQITTYVDQQFFIEPLGGPQGVETYLDRFPNSVYNKAPDSRLVKFMYALLGPAGGGWLRQNYLQARLILEDHGIQLGDLESFYGDPFDFPRILDEIYEDDPTGLLNREQWDAIKTKDAQYRSRIIDFLGAIRAGNSPLGMRLAARSGLGYDVEIVENYRFFYDQHSDDPIGVPYLGKTNLLEEMIVVPRQQLPKRTTYEISFQNYVSSGGTFNLMVNGQVSANLAYNADANDVIVALENLGTIGPANIDANGGPLPNIPIEVVYIGSMAYENTPDIAINTSSLTTGTAIITKSTETIDATGQVSTIPVADRHAMDTALERLKAVPTIITTNPGQGLSTHLSYNSVYADSAFAEVIRYVTGRSDLTWPILNNTHWIEANKEHESPLPLSQSQQQYKGYHDIPTIIAYPDSALVDSDYNGDNWPNVNFAFPDAHIGKFNLLQRFLYPILSERVPDDYTFAAKLALPASTEPLIVSGNGSTSYINNIYPLDYQILYQKKFAVNQGSNPRFWASTERASGSDFLEIDLGRVQAVNYISFEATQKPFDIIISYDLLDQAPSRLFNTAAVNKSHNSVTTLGYTAVTLNPWQFVELNIETSRQTMIYTRYIRLGFQRRQDPSSPFINSDGTINPFSIEVRNLRIGRNVV
jgi:hypothetical protein